MLTSTAIEPSVPWSWAEDVVLVVLFAFVGALGIAAGLAAGSQVEMSFGLVLVLFAASVLADVVRQNA